MKITKRRKKKLYYQLIVSIGLAALITLFTRDTIMELGPLKELELKFLDHRFTQRGEVPIQDTSKIIIVDISQESFDQIPAPYNSFPWPRTLYARLIDNLTEAGVKAIGIDILLSNRDRFSKKNDDQLARSIRRSGKVVLGGRLDYRREAAFNRVRTEQNQEKSVGLVTKETENYGNIFYSQENSLGLVDVINDKDGVFRRYYPYVYSEVSKKEMPSLGFATLGKYLDVDLKKNKIVSEDGYFRINDILIPKFDNSTLLVNFYGLDPVYTWKRFNFIDVIDDSGFWTTDEIEYNVTINTWDDPGYGLLHSGIFKDKIVLVGSVMPEDRDIIPVALSRGKRHGDNLLFGVDFHATVIQNVLEGNFLTRQGLFSEMIMIFLLVFVSYWVSTIIKALNATRGVIHAVIELLNFGLVVLVAYGVYRFSEYMFIEQQVVTAVVAPILAVAGGYVGSSAYNFISARQQSGQIKRMFSHYVSGELVNEMIDDPEKLSLGGERRSVTVLFSDIAGFSTFSENMSADELVGFMNEYLSEMTDIIIANKGTLDKYIGDAIMAFWGAPVEIEDHAYYACKAALEMKEKLEKMKKQWAGRKLPEIKVRTGINTGEVIVGNIGSDTRFNYTVMGDTVNLASRLEGANKQYGTYLMVSEDVVKQTMDAFKFRELDNIRVKGRLCPTRVYELAGFTEENGIDFINVKKLYCDALKYYKSRDFIAAKALFEKCFSEFGDPVSEVYLNRCEFYINNPPPDDWDGVFEMESK